MFLSVRWFFNWYGVILYCVLNNSGDKLQIGGEMKIYLKTLCGCTRLIDMSTSGDIVNIPLERDRSYRVVHGPLIRQDIEVRQFRITCMEESGIPIYKEYQ